MSDPLCLWHGDETLATDSEPRLCAVCSAQIATKRCAGCGLEYFDEEYSSSRFDPIHGLGQRDPDGHSCDHCWLDGERDFDEHDWDEDLNPADAPDNWDHYELDDF